MYSPEIYSGEYKKLVNAAESEDIDAIRSIVKASDLNLDYADSEYGISLLNWCIFKGKEKSFEALLELGANPNWQDMSGKFAPPIIEAAKNEKSINYLALSIKYNGNVNIVANNMQGISNQTPLLGSIYSKKIENMRLLVEKGADVNLTKDSLWTPLAETIIQGKIEMTKYLLENGADCRNLKFRTLKVNTDENGQAVLDSFGSPIMLYDRELSILSLLRNNQFDLDSREYKIKMDIVAILKTKGMDYWKEPVPEKIKTQHKNDSNYLNKY